MFSPETTETIGFKHCQGCGSAPIDRDRFCRRCGVSLSRPVEPSNSVNISVAGAFIHRVDRSGNGTELLAGGGTLQRSYSDPPANIVTQKLSEHTSPLGAICRAMFLISMLIAVPLWLIALLSPLCCLYRGESSCKSD